MFGGSKESGAIVGRVEATEGQSVEEATEVAGCEESLVCTDVEGNPLTLVSVLDQGSGCLSWMVHQDPIQLENKVLATNQMTSMLHDADRNRVYEKSIGMMIKHYKMKMNGREPVVIDVGCGTGLLSMMAYKAGAQCIIGCEMFPAMANVAEKVIEDNKMDDKIQVVAAKSTEMNLGEVQVDLLVSELLDSALLGESCIFSHSDVIDRMMDRDCPGVPISQRVCPHSADMFARLIQCDEVGALHDPSNLNFFGLADQATPWRDTHTASKCDGGRRMIPVHWETLRRRSGAVELSEEVKVLHFNFFSGGVAQQCQESTITDNIKATGTGKVTGLLLYWKTYLLDPAIDPQRECYYSTKPGDQNWQDHWVQCVFPLAQALPIKCGDTVQIKAYHDNLQCWFRAEKQTAATVFSCSGDTPTQRKEACEASDTAPKACTCGWHMIHAPDRLSMLNDTSFQACWRRAVDTTVEIILGKLPTMTKNALLLDVGDGSTTALSLAHKLKLRVNDSNRGRIKVASREAKTLSRLFYSQLTRANNLKDLLTLWDGLDLTALTKCFSSSENADARESGEVTANFIISALVSDCYQYQLTSCQTWQALSFHYQRTALDFLLSNSCHVIPAKAHIYVALFELTDLMISYGECGNVSGFDHRHLDDRQKGHQTAHWLPYRLADYEKTCLTNPAVIAELDYSRKYTHPLGMEEDGGKAIQLAVIAKGRVDCVAIWVDYTLIEGQPRLTTTVPGGGKTGADVDFVPWQKVQIKLVEDRQRRVVGQTKGNQVGCTITFDEAKSAFNVEIKE